MNFKTLYLLTKEINSGQTKKSEASYFELIFRKSGFWITPFFLKAQISANSVSLFGFFLGLISASLFFIGSKATLSLGLLFFLVSTIIDYCDGNVARMTNTATFFGRFIDGVIDIVITCSIQIAFVKIAFYQCRSESLMWSGIICVVLTPFYVLYFDRYSSYARWINQECKMDIKPYIRPELCPKLFNSLYDFQFLALFFLPIFLNLSLWVYFLTNIFHAVLYIYFHTISVSRHMMVTTRNHRS